MVDSPAALWNGPKKERCFRFSAENVGSLNWSVSGRNSNLRRNASRFPTIQERWKVCLLSLLSGATNRTRGESHAGSRTLPSSFKTFGFVKISSGTFRIA